MRVFVKFIFGGFFMNIDEARFEQLLEAELLLKILKKLLLSLDRDLWPSCIDVLLQLYPSHTIDDLYSFSDPS